MSYFDGIKVGDTVYPFGYDKCVVTNITSGNFPIEIQNKHMIFYMDYNGMCSDTTYQVVFWDEVKITPPSRPKVKEKKSETKWTSICVETGKAVDFLYGSVVCAERAVKGSCYSFIHVPVVIEWEE